MFKTIIDKIFNNKIPDIFSPTYEEYLLKQYGEADKKINDITLLIISDTHGTLNEDSFKKDITNISYDLCIMLGDHYNRDIDIIIRNVDNSKIYGIKGNHDYDYLSDYNIPNLNGNIIEVKGVKILGMEGSFKYKSVDFPSFTHEESLEFLNNKEKVDILVTHDKKFDPAKLRDPAHQGLIGITEYIYKNKIPVHIHGHIHESYNRKMINGTTEYIYKNKIPVHIHGHIHESYNRKMINGTTEYSVFGYEIIKIGGS